MNLGPMSAIAWPAACQMLAAFGSHQHNSWEGSFGRAKWGALTC